MVLKTWFKNARSVSLMQSGMPALLAVVMAADQSGFGLWQALLAVVGVMSAHLGMNLADDYFDYKADMHSDRDRVIRKGFRAMSVKYSYLIDGSVTPDGLLRAILSFGGIAVACGGVVFISRSLSGGFVGPNGSWWILAIATIACLLGWFYSAPPLKLAYRGLGEIVIGVIFGPLLMTGVYYSACGMVSVDVVMVSIPVGLLVLNILFTHSFIERESDAASNKMTLARLLGSNTANMAAAYLINFLPYLIVVVSVLLGDMSVWYLLVLVMVPNSVWLCRSLSAFNRGETGVPQKPQWWLGPMGNWDQVRGRGIDWFLMRWLAARNILSGFCAIVFVVRLVLLFF